MALHDSQKNFNNLFSDDGVDIQTLGNISNGTANDISWSLFTPLLAVHFSKYTACVSCLNNFSWFVGRGEMVLMEFYADEDGNPIPNDLYEDVEECPEENSIPLKGNFFLNFFN